MAEHSSIEASTREELIAKLWNVSFIAISADGVNLRVAVAGNGPLIILVHGFPESWYSWRHQIKPLVAAGYQVAIPDVRGYGESDKPHSIDAYSIKALSADMAHIAKALSPSSKAVIIGHDWGAPIAWNSAVLFDSLFAAVAGLSVPFTPPASPNAIELFHKLYTNKGLFNYMVYFQQEGVAETELQEDPERTIRLFYTALSGDVNPNMWQRAKPVSAKLFDGIPEPEMPRPWLSEDDIRYYASQFVESGFRGPLNRYRNFESDYEFLIQHGAIKISQPSLFIHGKQDMVNHMYREGPIKAMTPHVSAAHRAVTLENCGHWTQQEQPDAVNEILIDWLATNYS